MEDDVDVLAAAMEVLEIAEAARLGGQGPAATFTEAELAYARSKSDPERRLAARLAAKRAAQRLLGEDLPLSGIEVVKGPGGPPRLRLSLQAAARLAQLGGRAALVSLTHSRHHAAAAVVLLRARP